MFRISTSILFTLCFVCLSCKSEEPKEQLDLKGSWSIYDATRNGKVTKTLKGGVFMFTSDTSFTTNIFGDERLFTFDTDENKITTTKGDPSLKLKMSATHSDSLVLTTKIQTYDIELFMVRDSL